MINPIAFSIGDLSIRWYSLAYIMGILIGWCIIRKIGKPLLTINQIDDLIMNVILGVVLGGRLGYVLFYNLHFYLTNLADIFKLWHGGMSFHGGFLGVIIAMIIFSRKHKIEFLKITDLVTLIAPIGICLGRIANFINNELGGAPLKTPINIFGHTFVNHPSQLYESFLEGPILFCLVVIFYRKYSNNSGTSTAIFCIWYAFARFLVEFIRLPDIQIGYVAFGWLTMGQILSIPVFLLGIFTLLYTRKKNI